MMHFEQRWLYRYWVLQTPPPGAGVWCFKLAHFISNGQFSSVQLPSGITLRLIIRGSGSIKTSGGIFDVSSGSMFCAIPGNFIEIHENAEDPWQWLEFQLTGAEALNYVNAFGVDNSSPVVQVDLKATSAALRRMIGYYAEKGRNPYRALSLLYDVLHVSGVSGTLKSRVDRREELVNQARALIENQLGTNLNVNEIAGNLNVDRTTLLRAFNECLDTTPLKFLQKRRLLRAQEVLGSTDYSIRQVAAFCGFNDDKYFINCFRKEFGVTPGQWRKKR